MTANDIVNALYWPCIFLIPLCPFLLYFSIRNASQGKALDGLRTLLPLILLSVTALFSFLVLFFS